MHFLTGEASSSSRSSYEDSNATIQHHHDNVRSPVLREDDELSAEPEQKRRKNEKDSTEDLTISEIKHGVFNVVEPKEELPAYLPAIMGCRSVSEFQCLNK